MALLGAGDSVPPEMVRDRTATLNNGGRGSGVKRITEVQAQGLRGGLDDGEEGGRGGPPLLTQGLGGGLDDGEEGGWGVPRF